MKRLFKWTLGTLVVLVLLVAVAPLVAIQFVDPAVVKEESEGQRYIYLVMPLSLGG